ncbi:MAG TPA: hypothetical protein PKO06_12375 [Candidatus Ozemobacteraceae bacterium]|nr:hypothetical protein [Candidatus Ozemobacteraceae bacterium]
MKKLFLVLVLVCGLLFPALPVWSQEDSSRVITDLPGAYEIWKTRGIKFVIRENGQFVTWAEGRLESWSGKSKWVVRDPKGKFLTHAFGRIETWKTGKTRLVLRTPKGQIMTHIDINLTNKASFAQNVVSLRRLEQSRFLSFAQETIGELLIQDLKQKDTLRTGVLIKYLTLKKGEPGLSNFKPVLRMILPQLNFVASHSQEPKVLEMADKARELLKTI